ncbi:MAG: PHP domain-containing protein [Clostridia bacterium]|jgi:putative hydrolase|nr:PHP domain-containing protein [Clostridia bacterium]
MEFYGDFHCHTTYSDGRNTVDEMIEAARKKGLAALAITDHGPNNMGTGVKSAETYLEIRKEINKSMAGLEIMENDELTPGQVLLGAEANIIDMDGRVDLPRRVIKELDWLIIGLHPYIRPVNLPGLTNLFIGNQLAKLSGKARERVRITNTKALVESLHNYCPDCVSHPNLQMAVDLEEVAKACVDTGTLYEINTGHRFQQVEDIRQAVKGGVEFIVNSDSHYTATVGELDWGGELLEKAGVEVDQVYNAIVK